MYTIVVIQTFFVTCSEGITVIVSYNGHNNFEIFFFTTAQDRIYN